MVELQAPASSRSPRPGGLPGRFDSGSLTHLKKEPGASSEEFDLRANLTRVVRFNFLFASAVLVSGVDQSRGGAQFTINGS